MWMDNTVAHALNVVPAITTNFYSKFDIGEKYVKKNEFGNSKCGGLGKKQREVILGYGHSQRIDDWVREIVLWDCQIESRKHVYFLCKGNNVAENQTVKVKSATLETVVNTSSSPHIIPCPLNHTTHSFLACDAASACWARDVVRFSSDTATWDIPTPGTCHVPDMTSLPPSYACATGSGRVPYTLVCDHRQDCSDSSDESFCVFAACRGQGLQQCGTSAQVRAVVSWSFRTVLQYLSHVSSQCYTSSQYCDGQVDCVNEADEGSCSFISDLGADNLTIPPPPFIINFARSGTTTITPLPGAADGQWPSPQVCPDTHYQCAHNGPCLPTFTRCNGFYDCADHEDEAACDGHSCPGHFRCLDSAVCVHPHHLCDGVNHCPRADDELLCDLCCPRYCTCHGLAFTCPRPFPAHRHPQLRYLSVRGSGMTLSQLIANTALVYLSLADCRLHELANVTTLVNLVTLDLSLNRLHAFPLHTLSATPNLRALFLSNNLIKHFLTGATKPFKRLQILDLSLVSLPTLDEQFVAQFPQLTLLNLSQSGTQDVTGRGFQPMSKLRVLDLRGCPMTGLDRDLLRGLDGLRTVSTDNYRLCCAASLLPDLHQCQAPEDEVSSCQDLLRSNAYRVCLAIFNSLALMGNGASFVFRVSSLRRSGSPGFSVFVLHLCVSDFLMGVYLTVVGVADRLYEDSYVWKDRAWRHSAACKLAGVVSLVSCEVSAFIICLITLDRFLVVRFPLSFLRFEARNAQLASCASWIVGFILAAVPLLPGLAHWEFYSQTGICIPLPVTRKVFAGHHYSFGIMIVLNFVLFQFIAVGQTAIYWSVRSQSVQGGVSTRRSQDSDIARRLFTVAMSDFLCWFPVGVLGVLAARGVAVPGEVGVGVAILVLPLNSALNPFLYTLNLLLEKRHRRREDRLLRWMEGMK
ncbi:hypothetical protein ACOMHN_052867 [Nucella lapillus]